jgi:hypothetical protein
MPEGEPQEAGEDPNAPPEPKDGQPKSPLDGDDPNQENKAGDEPPSDELGPGSSKAPLDDGWGNLPQHVRDTFRSEGRGDMPTRYRDWIDAYYEKLNRHTLDRR